MNDYIKKLREQALEKQSERREARRKDNDTPDDANGPASDVARRLGVPVEVVDACCGSLCPHCQLFLDKAIALIQLGHPHHLFMNPTQERMFIEAYEIYKTDRKQYERRKQELMDAMRVQTPPLRGADSCGGQTL